MFRFVPSPLRHSAWPPSTAHAPDLEVDHLVQEEQAPTELRFFYPMRLGQVLNHRYQVTAKLGCGGRSSVWLARDLYRWKWQTPSYVAIKVSVTGDASDLAYSKFELRKTKAVKKPKSAHLGSDSVRQLLNYFYIRSTEGKHLCMVFEPLRETLGVIKYFFTPEVVPVGVLQVSAYSVLKGLDYLHSECHLIHCDLSGGNIIFQFADNDMRNSLLEQHSKEEWSDPSPVKRLAGRTIHTTRTAFGPLAGGIGGLSITDFDSSIPGDGDYHRNHDIQPEGHIAPEVILRAGFSYSADIWNFATLICGLIEGKSIFDGPDRDRDDRKAAQQLSFARMIAFLGPPPQELLDRGERTNDFFDEEGKFKFPELIPTDASFETFFTMVTGKEKEGLIAFVKRMLRWMPEERATAGELQGDEWVQDWISDEEGEGGEGGDGGEGGGGGEGSDVGGEGERGDVGEGTNVGE